MASTVFPAPSAASKTRFVVTLTSGTSWTVPTGVTYVNAKLVGGGGGGGQSNGNTTSTAVPTSYTAMDGLGGQIIETTVTTTPGASISYAIGAGGTGNDQVGNLSAAQGGTTTFTGATSAVGGRGAASTSYGAGGAYNRNGSAGAVGITANNGGGGGMSVPGSPGIAGTGGSGGNGQIVIEYWV